MLTKTKIALSVAIALGTASGAMAATNKPVHHRAAVDEQSGASSYATSAKSTDTGDDRAVGPNPDVIEASKREKAGDPRCWGGSCSPNWQ